MRALCWHGKGDVRVDTVPDPKIQQPRDAVIKITACAICGSDLHLLDGYQPTMESGDIWCPASRGAVIELGSGSLTSRSGTGSSSPSPSAAVSAGSAKRGCFP